MDVRNPASASANSHYIKRAGKVQCKPPPCWGHNGQCEKISWPVGDFLSGQITELLIGLSRCIPVESPTLNPVVLSGYPWAPMFQDPQSLSHEVVIFFAEGKICKEMMYPEFEAVLDGVVGLNDFAGESVQAAFLIISSQLKITQCVLFNIGFDRQGFADRTWNIPLRHLAETAGLGPDLGAGPIKLACRSQCPVAWHTDTLWDPDMSPQSNTFARLREVITENRLHLQRIDPVMVNPYQAGPAQNFNWQQVPGAPAVGMPMQGLPVGMMPPGMMQGYIAPGFVAAGAPPTLELGGIDPALLDKQMSVLEDDHRRKLASLLKAQRLHIQTLKTESDQKLAALKLKAQKEIQSAEIEITRLRSQHESLHSQNLALREQNEAQRKQLEALKRTREIELQEMQQQEREALQQLRKQSDEVLQQRLTEETAKLKEDIELRNMELMHRHEVAKQLREELCQLRKDKIRLLNQGADKFLERLESLGVSFIAFHPGAGHISVQLKDMSEYMENPTAFAANKCLVTEDQYRKWLAHYQAPACQAPLTSERVCGCKIPRTDIPSQFVAGESDRCEKHKARRGSDNVVNFRG